MWNSNGSSVCNIYLLGKEAIHSHHRPMWAFCSAAILLALHYTGLCGSLSSSPFKVWWANASQSSKWYSTCNRPIQVPVHKSLQVIVGQLYLLNKWAAHSHCGPMWTFCLTAILLTSNYTGPYGSLGSSPFWAWWTNASQSSKWYSTCNGPIRVPVHKSLQVIMGQLYLFNKWAAHSYCRPMWAFCLAAVLLALNYAGPCGSLGSSPFWAWWANASQLSEFYSAFNRPIWGLHTRNYKSPWASSTSLARSSPFTLWAHTIILLGSQWQPPHYLLKIWAHCRPHKFMVEKL